MTEILIPFRGKSYRMHFQEVYTGDSVSRYELSAGDKAILLERRKTEKNFGKRWKILSVNWTFQDSKTAAEFIHQIMVSIDEDIDGEKLYSYKPKG
jgi:hypothetical protein